jgi:hypothetical protein
MRAARLPGLNIKAIYVLLFLQLFSGLVPRVTGGPHPLDHGAHEISATFAV